MGNGTSPWWEIIIVGIVIAAALAGLVALALRELRSKSSCGCGATDASACRLKQDSSVLHQMRAPARRSGGGEDASQ